MGKEECLEHSGLQSNYVITVKEMHLKQKKKDPRSAKDKKELKVGHYMYLDLM